MHLLQTVQYAVSLGWYALWTKLSEISLCWHACALKKMQAPPGLLGSISCILLVLSTCLSQHFVAIPEPSTTEHPSIKKRKCLNKAGASGARGYPSQIWARSTSLGGLPVNHRPNTNKRFTFTAMYNSELLVELKSLFFCCLPFEVVSGFPLGEVWVATPTSILQFEMAAATKMVLRL